MFASEAALAGQVLVAGFPGTELPPVLVSDLGRGELAGVILFKRNLGPLSDVARLIAHVTASAPGTLPPLVAVDQEGGRVARFGPPMLRLPPMRKLGAVDDPDLTERAGRMLGAQLAAIGFTMDFAPVLDVDTNPANPVIGDRSFGRTPDVVTRHGLAFARGLSAGGVDGCGKHFPGHGDTDLDSHLALPKLRHGRDRLDAVELAPFRAARGAIPALMSAHVVFESIDPDVPATLSERVMTGLLRDELGYEGVVVSDDLEMRAVSARFGFAESAVRAIAAGCDLLLVCSDLGALAEARTALANEASKNPDFRARLERAAKRGLALRQSRPPSPIRDVAKLGAVFAAPEAQALEAEIAARCAEVP